MESEDKAKVVNALGGKSGIFDSTVPSIFFLISYNITHDLKKCLYFSIGLASLLMIIRLIRRTTLVHSVGGFIGAVFCAYFAWKTGSAKSYYAPSLWKNSAFLALYGISIAARFPLIGVVLGPILGENLEWRNSKSRYRAYRNATWVWFALFGIRLAIQVPLYKANALNALGVANVFLGVPLYLMVLWATWLIIKQVPVVKPNGTN
ncbi:MAG: hypothetical protein RL129_76 [Actinomycetota bacterium]